MSMTSGRHLRVALLAFLFCVSSLSQVQAQKRERIEEASAGALKVYTTRHFVLKSNSGDRYSRVLGAKLDEYYDQLSRQLPSVLGQSISMPKASIILFDRQDEYQRYARRNAPQLINNGGYYDGATRTVVTYRYNNSIQLYFHEILHAVMGEVFKDHYFFRYSKPNWPIWFDEGLAEYFGSFTAKDGRIRIGQKNKTKVAYLLNALSSGTFIGLRSLLTAPSERYSGASMNLYYAEAWGLLDFLIKNEPYNKALPGFFAAMKSDADGLAAFKKSFGAEIDDLDRRWRAHLWSLGSVSGGWESLFNGKSIDDWTIHEGGKWVVDKGAIHGDSDENYNYLIRSELPLTAFTFTLEVKVLEGSTGVILGNNFHGEYPYYYLIDFGHDKVALRRSYSATRITTMKEARPHLPLNQWLPVTVQLINNRLKVWVNGQEVLNEPEDKDRYSLFGVYLYRGKAQFKNIRIRAESPVPPAAPKSR
jgi:hypothetical protein